MKYGSEDLLCKLTGEKLSQLEMPSGQKSKVTEWVEDCKKDQPESFIRQAYINGLDID